MGPGRTGVVEIGGGAGHIAEAAWRGDAGAFTQSRWISLDLSPSLLGAQKRRVLEPSQPRGAHQRWSGLQGDAIDLPFRNGSLDGLDAMLDGEYRTRYPNPVKVEAYKPSEKRSGRTMAG